MIDGIGAVQEIQGQAKVLDDVAGAFRLYSGY